MGRTQPRKRGAHSGLATQAVGHGAGIRSPGSTSGALPAGVALPRMWPLTCSFLTHSSRESEKPCPPGMGQPGTALERRQAAWTLLPSRTLLRERPPPLANGGTGSFFLLSLQLGPKEVSLHLPTGTGTGDSPHSKPERRSLRMASWKAVSWRRGFTVSILPRGSAPP